MERIHYIQKIQSYRKQHPIVALLGPRQCGKTTLAKMYKDTLKNPQEIHYFDLEDPEDLARLDNAKLTLDKLQGTIIIDEIQKRPDLFPLLRVLVDTHKQDQHYLILGSASKDLLQQSSESLAGRIAYLELPPFAYFETNNIDQLWFRGGFPRSYLADSDQASMEWREFYIRSYLEQDLPNLGIQIPAMLLRRFWTMIAHYHGNIVNLSEIGRSLGSSDKKIREYLDILTHTFMARQLQPWHANIKKRQVKAPKVYVRDSGILHSLFDIHTNEQLQKHPKLGASWEGFALEEIIRKFNAAPHQCFFWATHAGAELDLLLNIKGKKLGFEFKYTDSPKITKSMKVAMQDLELDHLILIHPGKAHFPLDDNMEAMGIEQFLSDTTLNADTKS